MATGWLRTDPGASTHYTLEGTAEENSGSLCEDEGWAGDDVHLGGGVAGRQGGITCARCQIRGGACRGARDAVCALPKCLLLHVSSMERVCEGT